MPVLPGELLGSLLPFLLGQEWDCWATIPKYHGLGA